MMIAIVTCFLAQILFTVGAIVIFGLLIALCNKLFYKNMGVFGKAACYVTGFFGTPVHECSHALACLLFGHKIIEIKLFQINSADGTLGYVNHSYNPKNLYQRVGNFFIGVAPIVVISAILYLLSAFLLPDLSFSSLGQIRTIGSMQDFIEIIESVFFAVGNFFSYATTLNWWIFLLIGTFLALHMTLSGADIKNAWSGLFLLLGLVLALDVVLALIDLEFLGGFTRACLRVGGYLSSILILSLAVSVIAVAASYLFKKLFLRKKF